MITDELAKIDWLEPWRPIKDRPVVEHLSMEVRLETNPRHVLYGKQFFAVAVTDSEDVLLVVEDQPPTLAVVHLTNSGKPDQHDDFPWTVFYDNVGSFVSQCMKVVHEMRFG
jgi:hypothetical protein